VVIGILVGIGVPYFKATVANNRIKEVSGSLTRHLALARNEAIKRGAPVTVCAQKDAFTDCSSDAADWVGGWIVFVDTGDAGKVDGTDEIIEHFEPSSSRFTMDQPTADVPYVRLWPNGERG
jgi:type IV fimbrial biogenesis protein FimT